MHYKQEVIKNTQETEFAGNKNELEISKVYADKYAPIRQEIKDPIGTPQFGNEPNISSVQEGLPQITRSQQDLQPIENEVRQSMRTATELEPSRRDDHDSQPHASSSFKSHPQIGSSISSGIYLFSALFLCILFSFFWGNLKV